MYRPRGALARAIHARFHNDNSIDNIDTTAWYTVDLSMMRPEYQPKFVPFEHPDSTTVRWLEHAKTLSANIWMHLWHALARSVLQFFMTQTDINGFLKRGSMFILSEDQFVRLLKAGGFNAQNCDKVDILDIGAGDGEISLRVANSVGELKENLPVRVFATEASWIMRGRLKKLNFNVIEDSSQLQNVELITCLNVLDRCYDPLKLLDDMNKALSPQGRLLVALVLPYMHYVESNTSHQPLQLLLSYSDSLRFEQEAMLFFEVLESRGYQVEAWTKAPYLCEGDIHQSFYWLVDLIVVLSKKTSS